MSLEIGKVYKDTQWGEIKLLEIQENDCLYEVVKEKPTFIWNDDNNQYDEAVIHPNGTLIRLEGNEFYQKCNLLID